MDKPDVDFIEGLSPAISIDQKSASRNPRSTVGTITEVYDYLRLLYARIGVPHCPIDGAGVTRQTPQQIVDRVLELPEGTRFQVLAPVVRGRKGTYETLLADLATPGLRPGPRSTARCTSSPTRTDLARYEQHTIEVDRRPPRAAATASSAASPTRSRPRCGWPRAWPRSRSSRKDGDDAEAETLTFSQHLACPRAAESFEELAPRNFSFNSPYGACEHVRRARHPLRGRSRAGRAQPRPVDRRGRHRTVGQRAAPSTSRGCSRRWPRSTASPSTSRGRKLTEKQQQAAPLRHRREPGAGQVQEPLRPQRAATHATYEGVVPCLQRRHTDAESDAQPRADRGLHARGAVPRVRRRPPQAAVAGRHDRRPQHRRPVRSVDRRGGQGAARASSSPSATA